ncbi:MAG: hypothetical protein IKA56_04705 [Clostridia bacterium]|nr:hypothetical protein [Clostridia bacterium]
MYKLSYYLTEEEMSHSFGIYDRREGALKKSEIRKNYVIFILGGILFGTVSSFLNVFLPAESEFTQTEKIVLPAVIVFFSVLLFLGFGYMNAKKRQKQSEMMGVTVVRTGFDQKTPKNVEFFNDRIVFTSPYKRYTEYYDEMSYIVSDSICFTVVCRESGIFICIPKNGQDADVLFEIDNLLKEKFGERFIYEMGGVSHG